METTLVRLPSGEPGAAGHMPPSHLPRHLFPPKEPELGGRGLGLSPHSGPAVWGTWLIASPSVVSQESGSPPQRAQREPGPGF